MRESLSPAPSGELPQPASDAWIKILCRWAPLPLLLAVAVLLHACWNAPFYRVDDSSQILPAAVPWHEVEGERACFFLARCSFKLDYELFADKSVPPREAFSLEHSSHWASGSRILSGLLHALSGLLLLALLVKLGCSRGLALWVAVAWTAHPTALESLGWACERKTVLCGCFGFAALLAWAAGPRRPALWPLAWLCFAAALYSKGTALGLGPLFFLIAVYDLRRPPPADASQATLLEAPSLRDPRNWIKPVLGLSGLLALEIVGVAHTYQAFRQDIVAPPGGSTFTALLTDLEVLAKYLRSVFAPFWLSFYYGIEPVHSAADPRVWLYGLPLLAFFAALVWLARPERRALALLGIGWFFCGALPHLNLLSSSFLMQDRFIYLAMPGILLAAALALEGLLERPFPFSVRRKAPSAVLRFAAVASLIGLLTLSYQRSYLFADGDAVEVDAALREPSAAYAQLAAARIFRARVEGVEPERLSPESRKNARLTIFFYDRALAAPDFGNYGNPFVVRIEKAELLQLLDDLKGAREALEGWLPPKGMALLPSGAEDSGRVARHILYSGYRPEALAHAWAVYGQSLLRQSARAETILSQRLALVELGLDAARNSMLAHAHDYEGALLMAKLLLQRSILLEKNNLEASRAAWDQAAELLASIPEHSSRYALAQQLILNVPRP